MFPADVWKARAWTELRRGHEWAMKAHWTDEIPKKIRKNTKRHQGACWEGWYAPIGVVLVLPRFMRRNRPAPKLVVWPDPDGLLDRPDAAGGDDGPLFWASTGKACSAALPCLLALLERSVDAPVVLGTGDLMLAVAGAGPAAEELVVLATCGSAFKRSASFASWATICTCKLHSVILHIPPSAS